MDELIDIYDENGNYLKQEMKSIAHKLGLWHKSIHAILINKNNEMIIQKRSKDKDLYPSMWDFSFAGHVGAGENTVKSAIRECEEELGFSLNENQIELLFTYPDKLKWGKIISNEFVDIFLCRADFDINSFSKQDEEVDELKIIPLKSYIDMVKSNDKNIIPHTEEYKILIPILEKLI